MSLRSAGFRPTLAAGLTLLALAGCENYAPNEPVPVPPSRPEVQAAPEETPKPKPRGPSATSRALAEYYQRLEDDLVEEGLLRTDGGGEDTPYTDEMLARNFIRIALYDEYRSDGIDLMPEVTESRLRRWTKPVRLSVEFGESVGEDDRAVYRDAIKDYSQRLSRLTGLPILTGSSEPNYHVLVLSEDDRRDYGDRLRQLIPGISPESVRAFQTSDRSTLCLVLAFSQQNRPTYSRAIALIRAEHPPLLREACIHEELAQGLGLANDSPAARPSIFNDDEEFALLTKQDEQMLQILYDPRLEPGMTPEEAEPIVQEIASELVAADEEDETPPEESEGA